MISDDGLITFSPCSSRFNKILTTKKLSAIDLKWLQQQLLQIYPDGFPLIDTEGERLLFLDTVQHLFTDGGVGGGHLIPKQWISFLQETDSVDYPYDYAHEFEEYFFMAYAATSMIHARRDETIAKACEIYDKLSFIDMLKLSVTVLNSFGTVVMEHNKELFLENLDFELETRKYGSTNITFFCI